MKWLVYANYFLVDTNIRLVEENNLLFDSSNILTATTFGTGIPMAPGIRLVCLDPRYSFQVPTDNNRAEDVPALVVFITVPHAAGSGKLTRLLPSLAMELG